MNAGMIEPERVTHTRIYTVPNRNKSHNDQ